MKRLFGGFLVACVLAAGFVGQVVTAQNASALDFSSNYKLEQSKTHSGNLYVTGTKVEIDGDVKGSLYCGATGEVTINGKINGDVICATVKLTINGEVAEDARITGAEVSFNGKVGGDLSIASENFNLGAEAIVAGDLHSGSTTAKINGEVAGDVYLTANSLQAGSLLKVGGDLNYSAINELNLADGQVAGKVNYSSVDHNTNMLTVVLVNMAMFTLLAGVIVMIIPGRVQRSSEITKKRFGVTILAGFAALFLAPLVALLAIVIVVGWPVAIVLGLLYVLMLIVGPVLFAYFLGSIMLSGVKNIPLRMLGGVAFLVALCLIPVVNIIAMVFAVIVGSGMAVMLVADGNTSPRYSLNPPAPKPPLPKALSAKPEKPEKPTKTNKTTKKSTKKDK